MPSCGCQNGENAGIPSVPMAFEQPAVDTFEGLNLTDLSTDEAYVRIKTGAEQIFVYLLSQDCVDCPYEIDQTENKVLKLSTHYPWNIRIRKRDDEYVSQFIDDGKNTICEASNLQLEEFGVYDIEVNNGCNVSTQVEPVNANMAILFCALILIAIGIVYRATAWMVKKRYTAKLEKVYFMARKHIGYEDNNNKNDENEEEVKTKSRVKSLDTFRGITIALMIFVNDGAGGYWFFEHAKWNGLQLADVVFPWFMWIMGVCVPMMVKSVNKRKVPMGIALINVFRRSMVLFLLGFFWNTIGWINLEKLRIPGVLQRFAITYFVVASTGVIFSNSSERKEDKGVLAYFSDLLCVWQRWVVSVVFVVAHCLLTFALPVPGCPTGYLGPGGLHLYDLGINETEKCVGGASGYIDTQFFGVNHIYGNPTPKAVYGTGPYDPEGMLGSFTSVFQVFLGYQAGQIIMSYSGHRPRILRFLAWAIGTGAIGWILNGVTRDEGLIPINKNLWSLSYVFVTSGLAFLLMAIIYILIDAHGLWAGEPFIFAGMNSIVLYLGHYIAWQMGPFNYASGPMNTHWDRLVESIWSTSSWLIVAYIMYRKKVFITV